MGGNAPTGGGAKYRLGVGIMLLNERGEVFVARRADVETEAWQMPQGGIDDGEDPRTAALRELEEEIGTARMRRYALKHDGVRRYLASDEETNAAQRALSILAGHRTLNTPPMRQ